MTPPSTVSETVSFIEAIESQHGIWVGVNILESQVLSHVLIELWPDAIKNAEPYYALISIPGGRQMITTACFKLGRVRAGSDWHPKPFSRDKPA